MIKIRKLMLLFLVILSMVAVSARVSAGTVVSVQVIDGASSTGVISGKLDRDFTDLDLYLVMVSTDSGVYSLTASPGFLWKEGVEKLRSYDLLAALGWESIGPVDLSRALSDPEDTVFHLVLVKRGRDPLETSNWIDHGKTGLIVDPGMRVPGQIDFVATDQEGGFRDLTPEAPTDVADDTEGRDGEIEKPDIYKVRGDTVYYANTGAGRFQAIDLKDPASPLLSESLTLDHTPVELFLADDLICLIEEREGEDLALRIFSDEGGTLSETGTLVIPGGTYEVAKRLDNLIYLVARGIRAFEGNDLFIPFERGDPVIYAVDIQNPAIPALLAQKVLKGYDPEIYMDRENLIFLAKESWEKSLLEIFDLTTSAAPLSSSTTLEIPGRVPSEFHINVSGRYLRVVYRSEKIEEGSALAIYDLFDRKRPIAVGSVSRIAPGEELFAARFSNDRAYVVTYERTDPLWVLDLANPEKPVVLGELEVPGWSEYMTFFDEKLLAIGYDDTGEGRLVSVALFSVEDPTRPALLDRVTPLSGKLAYSYSAAIDDERAFYLDLADNLILFPLRYYEGGDLSGVTIISMNEARDRFAENGFLSCDFNVKRSFETGVPDIVAGMGDGAMNTIDITSVSAPVEKGFLRLANQVVQVAGKDERGRIWSVGGDYYYGGEGEIYLHDSADLSMLLSAIPAMMNSPRLVMEGEKGVLFSGESASIRGVTLENETVGPEVGVGEGPYMTFHNPFISGEIFHFGEYVTRKVPEPKEPVDEPAPESEEKTDPDPDDPDSGRAVEEDIKPDMPPYEPPEMEWRLHRYDFADSMAPEALKALSIPGRPLGITDGGRILCVEESSCYYCDAEKQVWGVRLNLVSIAGDHAYLDQTVFVETGEFSWPSVVMDGSRIYVVTGADSATEIRVLLTEDLASAGTFTVDDAWLYPVKAREGKVLFTEQGWYPYLDLAADIMYEPGYGASYVVYDLNGAAPVNVLEGSDAWLNQENVIMLEEGIYFGNGYRGIRFVSY